MLNGMVSLSMVSLSMVNLVPTHLVTLSTWTLRWAHIHSPCPHGPWGSYTSIEHTSNHPVHMDPELPTHPVTLSTWTLRWAICCVSLTWFASSRQLTLVNTGIFTAADISPTLSLVSNPQSANIKSAGNRLWRRPLFSVTCLSLKPPPHPLEMKATAPCGVMPIRYSRVRLCLEWEHICALAFRFDVLSMLSFKAV